MTQDLTRGKPLKLILQFTIPALLGLLLQQVYSLVDTMIVGRALGVIALGGVGATGSLNFLVIGFCNGLCTGMAIPLAQAFGAGEKKQLRVYLGNIIWLGVLASAVMLMLTLPLCRQMLHWMATPTEQIDYAFDYIFIVFCGIPATILYNIGACILRALGDSKTPVWFLAIASVVNIVLDLFTVYVLKMGVSGAAVATVMSQIISGVLCVFYMKKHFPILHMEKEDRKFRGDVAKRLLGMGVPVGLQFSITAIGSVMLQSAVNSLGAIYVSANAVAGKIYMLVACPYDALAMTTTNFCGQNLGAGKYDRIRQGTYACTFVGLCYCVVHILIAVYGTHYAIMLFMSPEEAQSVLVYTQKMCTCNALLSPLLMLVNVFRLAIQGMGFSKMALCAGVLEMIARTCVGIWLVPRFGYTAACFASPLAWLFADLFLVPAFFYCLHLRERQAEESKRIAARE